MNSSLAGRGARNGSGELSRTRTRQTASRKLARAVQVGFKITEGELAEIKAAAWRDGQSQSDWLASAVSTVLKRGRSPLELAASPDVQQLREGLVVLGNIRALLEYALAEFAHPRITSRRRAQAREHIDFASRLLKVIGKQVAHHDL